MCIETVYTTTHMQLKDFASRDWENHATPELEEEVNNEPGTSQIQVSRVIATATTALFCLIVIYE